MIQFSFEQEHFLGNLTLITASNVATDIPLRNLFFTTFAIENALSTDAFEKGRDSRVVGSLHILPYLGLFCASTIFTTFDQNSSVV